MSQVSFNIIEHLLYLLIIASVCNKCLTVEYYSIYLQIYLKGVFCC